MATHAHLKNAFTEVEKYKGHFRSNIAVPVTSLCMIQFSKNDTAFCMTIHFLQNWLSLKEKKKKKCVLSLKILVYIYGRYNYTG